MIEKLNRYCGEIEMNIERITKQMLICIKFRKNSEIRMLLWGLEYSYVPAIIIVEASGDPLLG